jgi:hypothetical protein
MGADKPGYRQTNTIAALLDSLRADAPVGELVVGAFWTAVVLDTDPPRCGLASTLRPENHDDGPPVAKAGQLARCSGRELAELLRSSSLVEASIGMAALNALLDVDEAACQATNGEHIILERGAGRQVAIVGHFPFVEQVRRAAAVCWVPAPRPGPQVAGASRAPNRPLRLGAPAPQRESAPRWPLAEVVALTGTSLINHTFDTLVRWCHPDAFVMLLGGSSPLSPVLLDHRVSAVAGTRVTDVPAALAAISQGATFPQIPGKRLLTMTVRP